MVILVATIFPRFLPKYLITAPIAYLLLAFWVFAFFPESPLPHPAQNPYLGKRLAELGVILSLTSAGLKLKEPNNWRTWCYSARLLLFTMPLTIALIALYGWKILGLVPAAALLLGAVIAPTDPVLAYDIQTTPPHEDDVSSARLALTTEAGLNDGLAFPFTNMAIAMALAGTHPELWFSNWLYTDVLYKIVVGVLVGVGAGWLIAYGFFLCPRPECHHSVITVGLLSLSLTLIPYGIAELLNSYGFIAVFVCACTFRYEESVYEYLPAMHDFSEQIEKILTVVLFTVIGVYFSGSFYADFQWYMIPAALMIVLFIRPVTGYVALLGTGLPLPKRAIIAFYGIRGIGSIYYLLYAFYHARFEQAQELLALVMVVILFSVFIHGLTAKFALERCKYSFIP